MSKSYGYDSLKESLQLKIKVETSSSDNDDIMHEYNFCSDFCLLFILNVKCFSENHGIQKFLVEQTYLVESITVSK